MIHSIILRKSFTKSFGHLIEKRGRDLCCSFNHKSLSLKKTDAYSKEFLGWFTLHLVFAQNYQAYNPPSRVFNATPKNLVQFHQNRFFCSTNNANPNDGVVRKLLEKGTINHNHNPIHFLRSINGSNVINRDVSSRRLTC